MKTCTRCERAKPLTEFYVVKRPSGPYRRARCKSCESTQASLRYIKTTENPEKLAEIHDRRRRAYWRDKTQELEDRQVTRDWVLQRVKTWHDKGLSYREIAIVLETTPQLLSEWRHGRPSAPARLEQVAERIMTHGYVLDVLSPRRKKYERRQHDVRDETASCDGEAGARIDKDGRDRQYEPSLGRVRDDLRPAGTLLSRGD